MTYTDAWLASFHRDPPPDPEEDEWDDDDDDELFRSTWYVGRPAASICQHGEPCYNIWRTGGIDVTKPCAGLTKAQAEKIVADHNNQLIAYLKSRATAERLTGHVVAGPGGDCQGEPVART